MPKPNKNIVTVGRLKQIVAELSGINNQLDYQGKVDPGSLDADDLKNMNIRQSKIDRYSKMIANPSKYQPKKK